VLCDGLQLDGLQLKEIKVKHYFGPDGAPAASESPTANGQALYSRRSILGTGGKIAGLAAVGGALGLGGALVGRGSGTSEPTIFASTTSETLATLNVQLQWIKNVQWAGTWIAFSRGYYKAAGVSPTITPGGPSTSVQPLVAAGTADVGIADAVGTAQARAQGAPLVIVAATYQKSPNGFTSLAKAPIKTPAELIGKKVGMTAGSLTTYKAFMTANGIDPSKTTIVPIQEDPSPLVTGEVDVLYVYTTNQSITLETRGVKVYSFLQADFHFPLYDDVYIVSEATLQNPTKRQAVVDYLKAEQRGWQVAVTNPTLGAQLALDDYGKDLGLALNQQILESKAQNPLVKPAGFPSTSILTLDAEGVTRNLATIKAAGVATTASLFDATLI
jgi:ABC-type nitrate/sulfonate/bicarbonate transport system substrate-binding protein